MQKIEMAGEPFVGCCKASEWRLKEKIFTVHPNVSFDIISHNFTNVTVDSSVILS